MKTIVKFMLSNINMASRNKREIQVLLEMGHNVIAFYEDNNLIDDIATEGYRLKSFQPFSVNGPKPVRILRIVHRWIIIARQLRAMNADCISCHGMFGTLIGWISTLFVESKRKPILVYDSHEYELAYHEGKRKSKLYLIIMKKLEKFIIKKSAFTIEVNDSIAEEVKSIHSLEKKPIVVRNIPNYWNIDKNICKDVRKKMCDELGVPIDTFIIMYHGFIMRGRGIETILESIHCTKNVVAVFLGNGDESYIKDLKGITSKLNISKRILFHKAVDINILWQYVGAADVGMVTIPATSRSYYYMLPNKLFENIQSMTPIIGSNFPEIKKVVKDYDIGILVDPDNTSEIVNAIEQLQTNKELYSTFVKNMESAKEELCWENERQILENAYKKVL